MHPGDSSIAADLRLEPESLVPDVTDRLRENLEEIRQEIKPRLRGWLHAATAPLAFFSFLVLLVLAESTIVRAGVAVFMVSALALFTCSAIYHTRTWSSETFILWRRIDHANIYLLIAGSLTPYALLLLERREAVIMLALVWGGALLGIAFRVFWVHAPRWLYVPPYVLLGLTIVPFWDEFRAGASPTVLTLLLVGGAIYALGAVVYGVRRPDPWPRWFGYHEVFHALTIIAFAMTYVGVSVLAVQQH